MTEIASTSMDTARTRTDDPADRADPDDALIARYLDGEAEAFDDLYARHKDPLYRFFLRQFETADANDAFQETWTKLVTHLNRYKPQGNFTGYLFTLAHNVAMDRFRRDKRFVTGLDDPDEHAAETQTPETAASSTELADLLKQEIRNLPINQRTVWLMKNETGLTAQQIASVTGATTEAVKSRLRYATDKLLTGLRRHVR